jgi:hypothetical protein
MDLKPKLGPMEKMRHTLWMNLKQRRRRCTTSGSSGGEGDCGEVVEASCCCNARGDRTLS